MKKEEYQHIIGQLLTYFKKDIEVTDALKFVNDAVELNHEQIFKKNQKAQKPEKKATHTNFPVPKNLLGKPHTFLVFSDGACRGNPGPGAWGTVIQDSDEKVIATLSGIEFQTTNNQMELLGAINGLKELSKILEKNIKKAEIYIFSDSKYLVEGMSKWLPSWKKRNWKKADNKTPENLELWQSLDQLNSIFKTVHFNWVKGHAGHPQNEYCDKLANEALDDAGC